MFKVFGHLSCENHVNDGLSKRSIFIPREREKEREAESQRGENLDGCKRGKWSEMTVW